MKKKMRVTLKKSENLTKYANYNTEMYSLASCSLPNTILENHTLRNQQSKFQLQAEC